MGRIWVVGLALTAGLAGQRIYTPPTPSPSAVETSHPAVPPALPAAPAATPVAAVKAAKPAPPQPPAPDPLIAGHDVDVGTFYYNRGDYAGALARFQDAIYNDPDSPEAYCRAGDTENKLKQRLPARDDWQRCLRIAESGKWAKHAQKALAKYPAAEKPRA